MVVCIIFPGYNGVIGRYQRHDIKATGGPSVTTPSRTAYIHTPGFYPLDPRPHIDMGDYKIFTQIAPGKSTLSYREIPLTKGKVAIVSAHRYDELRQLSWLARKPRHRWYAFTYLKDDDGKYHQITMHSLILGRACEEGESIDHVVTAQTLNNTDENLRFASQTQQCRNRSRFRSGSGKFKGVYLRENKKFRAGIRIDKILNWLGTRDTAEECARLYDRAAIKRFGEFAVLNFPRADYEPGGVAFEETAA